jgi:3-dehydroquinate synthetase
MELDKKKRAGRVPFVLPKQIGEVVILSDVDQREIEEALEEARDYGPEDI